MYEIVHTLLRANCLRFAADDPYQLPKDFHPGLVLAFEDQGSIKRVGRVQLNISVFSVNNL